MCLTLDSPCAPGAHLPSRRASQLKALSDERKNPQQVKQGTSNIRIINNKKRVTSTLFSDILLCLQLFKNDQLKIVLMLKRHILGVVYSAPLQCIISDIKIIDQGRVDLKQIDC